MKKMWIVVGSKNGAIHFMTTRVFETEDRAEHIRKILKEVNSALYYECRPLEIEPLGGTPRSSQT